MKTLGEIIKSYREEKNISMDKFSELSGLSKGYISMLEKNKNPRTGDPIVPSLETYKSVSKAINISVDNLIKLVDGDEEVIINEAFPDSFATPKEAMNFMLNQAVVMGFNGLDITKLSEEEQIQYANDMLEMMKLVSLKYKDKK